MISPAFLRAFVRIVSSGETGNALVTGSGEYLTTSEGDRLIYRNFHDSSLLLEDGSYLLLEDGTSTLLLETP